MQFIIHMHYPAGPALQQPFTAILRAHILSVRSPQARFIVRGTRGTYTKFGVDGQEDQLKAMKDPLDIFSAAYGKEPESLWGNLEIIGKDETSTTTSM
jgi:hypothetical protein